eukprot:12901350-Prorocentrum_lima.AAC.1
MWGLKDAPRAFSMRLRRSLKELGYQQGIAGKQIWRKFTKNMKPVNNDHCGFGPHLVSLISTHIDDIKGRATDHKRDLLLATLKKHYGEDAK